ncbi:MAG TPA: aminodeoxychorismate synthase component I [Anaerolineales bacterium]|nr:aminodeoxychorismate synthase component I [Anaerolineales bacterium]
MTDIKPQRGPVRENEILLKDTDIWLHFANPYRLIRINTLADIVPALREVEQRVEENGWHAAGFLSYEAAPAFDPALRVRAPEGSTSGFPHLWFGLFPPPEPVALPEPETAPEALDWSPTVDREEYHAAVEQIRQHIASGWTYQVNYSMRLQADFRGEAWDLFLQLAQHQNRHAAYLDLGSHVICSVSPELFFQLDGDVITCRPMKGTARRGRTTAEDRDRSQWLKNSEKNRAENVMIVDMVRNDLGRIARTGSVRVPELFQMERYPTLWQMTSTVTASTQASLTEIFSALFPSASITGAPKVSTMGIIADLENTPRRIYTGSIGYFAPGRRAKFNVAIRTLLIDRERRQAEYGAGGGIVWDSTGPDEFAEALLKARVLTERPAAFSLLETLLWTPKKGFFLGEEHVSRMLDSAQYFDIPITREKLDEYLKQLSGSWRAPHRVRLLLDREGNLQSESSAHDSAGETSTLSACLAQNPIDSKNIFFYHKTTQRVVYDLAREGFPEFDDVLLYNEWDELTEFTIGNLVVELDGRLFTPPITCGVLPGTFRAHLLEIGQLQERTIRVDELKDCTRIFRVNSVRRWQEVHVRSEIRKAL